MVVRRVRRGARKGRGRVRAGRSRRAERRAERQAAQEAADEYDETEDLEEYEDEAEAEAEEPFRLGLPDWMSGVLHWGHKVTQELEQAPDSPAGARTSLRSPSRNRRRPQP